MTAQIWEDWNSSGGPKYPHEKVIQYFFRNFSLPESECGKTVNVLDLGCGNGVHTRFLASEGCHVVATDISKNAISRSRESLKMAGLNAEFRVENVSQINFPDKSFDLIICIGVYDSAGPISATLSIDKVKRVLKPSGKALFIFSSDRDFRVKNENPLGLHGYSYSEVEKMFSEGFSNVWIDRYITTYKGGSFEQNDWLVTLEK